MANLNELNEQSFDVTINGADTPMLVDFHAPWCGPCVALSPTLESVANDYAGRLQVAKVNIDDNPELAARFGIQSIPSLTVFDSGEPIARIEGLVSKGELVAQIEPVLDKFESASV
jgi:thioredoxin 1